MAGSIEPCKAPDHLLGVWKRAFITAPAQGPPTFRDETTQVFWLQTRTLFGDLRIKESTHDGLPSSLPACDEAACAKLATQRACAGVITLTEGQNVCQWHSDVDFQPLGGPPDIGRLKLESQHQLIETGTTADYLEDWRLLPSSQGDTFAFRLSDSSARTGVLLVAGQHFMFVADRQQPLAASGAKLEDVLKPLGLEEQRAALQFELSYGQLGDSGWHIMHSTLPGRAGQQLLGPEVTGPSLRQLAASKGKLKAGEHASPDGWALSDWSEEIPQQPVQ